MDYKVEYERWLADPFFDEQTKKELQQLTDESEIKDRFYKGLEFGTGGLRGIIGAGTNRMNIYTVGKATQGVANYIFKQKTNEKGVVIAYDSRRMSPEFAECAALVLNANGIKAYVFESLRPTPELSFAVRYLKCTAGIVITASHNPPEYNGYKLYWEDGGQVPYPRDEEIIGEVNLITDFSMIKTMSKEAAVQKGLFQYIGAEIDDAYIAEVKKQIIQPDVIEQQKSLGIVYTPLHGTGNLPVRRVLKEVGFENVFVVPEQELPDSDFSTVGYPNPEDMKVFTLGIQLAKEKNADIIIATDPDADRVGVLVKDKDGAYVKLTGNMSGSILCDYIITQKKNKGILPADGVVIKTIVSTELADEITKYHNVEVMNVLTGFKYIGEKIKLFEETGKGSFIFGFEESYGSLTGTYARDKDAILTSMLIAEVAAFCKSNNITLLDYLEDLYKKCGYYYDEVMSISLKGIEGTMKIQKIMEQLRENPIKEIAGTKVTILEDFQESLKYDYDKGLKNLIELPVSNVLRLTLIDGSWFCVRPSGTEPKLKIYVGCKGVDMNQAKDKYEKISKALMSLIESI